MGISPGDDEFYRTTHHAHCPRDRPSLTARGDTSSRPPYITCLDFNSGGGSWHRAAAFHLEPRPMQGKRIPARKGNRGYA